MYSIYIMDNLELQSIVVLHDNFSGYARTGAFPSGQLGNTIDYIIIEDNEIDIVSNCGEGPTERHLDPRGYFSFKVTVATLTSLLTLDTCSNIKAETSSKPLSARGKKEYENVAAGALQLQTFETSEHQANPHIIDEIRNT